MTGTTEEATTIQLDRSTRSKVERAVLSMRSTAESDLRYQLTDRYALENPESEPPGLTEEEREQRSELRAAIERERVDGHDWPAALERYVQGAGYTVVNRLAALRCMEARGFLDRPVTQFREDGRTPAADPLIDEEFLTPEEAIYEAYHRTCDRLAEEVELLFDRGSAYSQLEPRPSALEELCRMLDEVPQEAWRADDVLGWVYQYYHLEELDELRSKAGSGGLDPEDVAPANQFYTPHWVVRMLTDNSLGKLYLERVEGLETAVEVQKPLSPKERKHRSLDPDETPTVADLCTYLVPGSEAGESTDWSDPSELRVIDPACGSGHFLLYAFDVLERIWWVERPEVPRQEVPAKILRDNLYGVDIDLRACQLAAFNLYLKARSRAEVEGAKGFELPPMNLVCADARVAEIEEAEEVFAEVAPEGSQEREALQTILETFRGSYGLGSLLDVKGTLREELADEQRDVFAEWAGPEELLGGLVEAVERRREDGSFLVRDLRSFLRLLEVLAGSYDVALMNPPYGSGGRMPTVVKEYLRKRYRYRPEFYISFFEVCERLARPHGRVGMLVPRTFMFKQSFENFRRDVVGTQGAFDFLAEYGLGVLDNATVRTAGTVIRKIPEGSTDFQQSGLFIRLHDEDTAGKEPAFLGALSSRGDDHRGGRIFKKPLSDFRKIPGFPLSYWVPSTIRRIYASDVVLDADNAGLERASLGTGKQGLSTSDNRRFYRRFWEVPTSPGPWIPIAKGGSDAFVLPRVDRVLLWEDGGLELERFSKSVVKNRDYYFREGVTWPQSKETGRRFGYLPDSGAFDVKGSVFFPDGASVWVVTGVLNSELYHYLMLGFTPERDWQVGDVAQLPWDARIEEKGKLESLVQELYRLRAALRASDPASVHYRLPELLFAIGTEPQEMRDHPHAALTTCAADYRVGDAQSSQSLEELSEIANRNLRSLNEAVVRKCRELDEEVYAHFGLDQSDRKDVRREISLRGGRADFRDGVGASRLGRGKSDLGKQVRELIAFFARRVMQADEDGVVPLGTIGVDEEPDLPARAVGEFDGLWGEHAEERLREVDQALGDQAPTGAESYPNLRAWLNEELFADHTSTYDNTPFLWRLTTERLVPDAKGEGFGCLLDYHQLSASTFDTLHRRYLQPRRAALRERREAADERRRDRSLPAATRTEAEEEFRRCRSGIEQIEALEEALRELARPQPREWSEEDLALAKELGPKVAQFRERLEERLATLDRLFDVGTDAWLEDTFSPTFRERVQENRGEWIDALEDLETACEAYALPATEPVEAHLYDLFVYYNDKLSGSIWPTSNGFFSIYYYLSDGKKYLTEAGEPRSGLQESELLLAELGLETDADIELGEEIARGCEELADRIPSDWEERALAEVTTAGYQPVHKHGVRINIIPLARAKLLPELVEKKVI